MNRQQHNGLCRLVLGNSCNMVNSVLDFPSKFLGPKHRVLFHDPVTATLLGVMCDGKNPVRGAVAGLLHIGSDWFFSGMKKTWRM